MYLFFFFFTDPATTEIYTLSLHDALPISILLLRACWFRLAWFPLDRSARGRCIGWLDGFRCSTRCSRGRYRRPGPSRRSEEHTSELQSLTNLVCRLLLEKKNKTQNTVHME